MISDQVFIDNLDKAFKEQGFKKREREELINGYLSAIDIDRDEVLDIEERKAREVVAKKKQDKSIPTEYEEHCKTVARIRAEYPWITPIYIHNGGSRTPREKTEQLLLGLYKGASDLFLPQIFTWLEMKRIKNWEQSEDQIKFEKEMIAAGYNYILGIGCDDAMDKIDKIINNR